MSKDLAYFEKNVDKVPCLPIEDWVPDNMTDCWLWKLAVNGSGRPTYCDRSLASHNQLATRGLWRILRNPALNDPNVFLCHRCPHILCINPDHLYEGDAKQNRNDEVNRRRCRLTKLGSKTDEIVKLFKQGVEQEEIAKQMGVCRQQITRFLNGHTNQSPHNYIKEAEDIRNSLIKRLFAAGKSMSDIMNEAKVSATVVYSIVPDIKDRPKGTESAASKALKNTMSIEQRNIDIRKKREEGISVRDLAIEYSLGIQSIYGILKPPASHTTAPSQTPPS